MLYGNVLGSNMNLTTFNFKKNFKQNQKSLFELENQESIQYSFTIAHMQIFLVCWLCLTAAAPDAAKTK